MTRGISTTPSFSECTLAAVLASAAYWASLRDSCGSRYLRKGKKLLQARPVTIITLTNLKQKPNVPEAPTQLTTMRERMPSLGVFKEDKELIKIRFEVN